MVNKARTQKLIAKNKSILKLLNQTQLKLIELIKDPKYYSGILKNIILEVCYSDQGLIKLMENKVYVRCLQKDVPQVKSVLSECASEYKKIIKSELGEDIQVELSIDEERFLQ